MNPLFLKNYVAGAAIAAFRIVKFSAEGIVVQASAATDGIIGSSNEVGPASGERCDIVHVGIATIEAGAAIAVGAPITSDANGRAVTAAPAAGANVRIIGYAVQAASALGDQIGVLLSPCSMQG